MNQDSTKEQEKKKKEFEIIDNLNNKFRVTLRDDNNFECKKVLNDGTLIDPTREELIYIMKEIQKKLETLKSENVIQNYDSLLMTIKTLIDNGTLNSLDEIRNYINGLNLTQEEKEKLIQESYKYLESKSVEKTPITLFKDKIIENLRKDKQEGVTLVASFNVRENITGIDNCEVTLTRYDEKGSLEIEKQTFDYTEELKKDLIEPVLEELVLSTEIEPVNYTPVPGGFYRSNMQVNTIDNRMAQLNNIEEGYANDLNKHINELSKEAKITDNNERDDKLEELQQEKSNEQTRKRIKPNGTKEDNDNNNKGFSSNYLIYGIISLVTTLLVILQILFIS